MSFSLIIHLFSSFFNSFAYHRHVVITNTNSLIMIHKSVVPSKNFQKMFYVIIICLEVVGSMFASKMVYEFLINHTPFLLFF